MIFSPSYFDTTIVAVVRNGDRALQMLADLNGKLVSGASGTTSELAIRRSLPGARGVFKNKTGGSALFRLMSREIDAAVMDGPAADSLVSQAAGQLRRMPEPLAVESYALALPRTQTEISARLATARLATKRFGRQFVHGMSHARHAGAWKRVGIARTNWPGSASSACATPSERQRKVWERLRDCDVVLERRRRAPEQLRPARREHASKANGRRWPTRGSDAQCRSQ